MFSLKLQTETSSYFFVALLSIAWAQAHAANSDPSLSQVLSAHAEAMGGLDAWQAVTSLKTESRFSSGPVSGRQTSFRRRDGRFRQETATSTGDSLLVFDGTNGWSLSPGARSAIQLPAPAARSLKLRSLIGGSLLGAASDPKRARLAEPQQVNGERYHVVELDVREGQPAEFLIHAETHLLEFIKTSFRGVEATTTFADYREVDGLLFAFSVVSEAQTMEVNSIELNLTMPDSLFDAP